MILSGLLAFARRVQFIEDPATVLERAVDVVQIATRAAWVAAYTWTEAGVLTRTAASGEIPFGTPDTVDDDDPTLVVLRSERIALEGAEDSLLAGALVLPFVTGGGITGLIAVGPGLEPYALVDREAIHAVASATGLALESLQARALRKELEHWRDRAEWAERELGLLQRVLTRAAYAPGSDAAGGSLAGNESASLLS